MTNATRMKRFKAKELPPIRMMAEDDLPDVIVEAEIEEFIRQELHCHNCDMYVHFDLDLSVDGQVMLNCPQCNHEHYRYVYNGVISDQRWGSANRPMPIINAINIVASSTSVDFVSAGGSTAVNPQAAQFLRGSWNDFATGT